MKILIIALLLSGGSAFAEVLSKETVDAYATSISDIFAPESQETIEKEIIPALSQVNPTHAKDIVRQAKLTVRKYKGPINGPFVAGVIFALDTVNTQAHDVDAALTSAVSAPADAPAASDDIASTLPIDTTSALPVASADTPNASPAPIADATAANAPIVPAVDSTAGTLAGIDSQIASAHAPIDPPTAVNLGTLQQLPVDQKAAAPALVDHHAAFPPSITVHPKTTVHHAPTTTHSKSAAHHAPTDHKAAPMTHHTLAAHP